MMGKTYINKEQALQKARHYCGYQERCHKEVRDKLYELGLRKDEIEPVISTLIEENYLNEERFAIMFAGGHFRSKNWGRNKIVHALRQKQVSPYCIRTALQQIDGEDYLKILQQLFDKKLQTFKDTENVFVKKRKMQEYLLQKGFEPELVNGLITKL